MSLSSNIKPPEKLWLGSRGRGESQVQSWPQWCCWGEGAAGPGWVWGQGAAGMRGLRGQGTAGVRGLQGWASAGLRGLRGWGLLGKVLGFGLGDSPPDG